MYLAIMQKSSLTSRPVEFPASSHPWVQELVRGVCTSSWGRHGTLVFVGIGFFIDCWEMFMVGGCDRERDVLTCFSLFGLSVEEKIRLPFPDWTGLLVGRIYSIWSFPQTFHSYIYVLLLLIFII